MPSAEMTVRGAEATIAVGAALAPLLHADDVIALSGDLGAGKTHLAKGIATGLGVAEPVTSPTFNLLLVHEGRLPLFHFDLYRLDSADELLDLDYWGTLESGGVSVVEWAERFEGTVPAHALHVEITIPAPDTRRIAASGAPGRGSDLAREWLEACRSVPGVELP